jgi:hypothetical protein
VGRIVGGDLPADIQAAFESLPQIAVNTDAVHRLFDRVEIGRFLLSALIALGAGRPPPDRDYTHHLARSAMPVNGGQRHVLLSVSAAPLPVLAARRQRSAMTARRAAVTHAYAFQPLSRGRGPRVSYRASDTFRPR